jgi:hypothetical protein
MRGVTSSLQLSVSAMAVPTGTPRGKGKDEGVDERKVGYNLCQLLTGLCTVLEYHGMVLIANGRFNKSLSADAYPGQIV